jgi:Cys-tRNA(Pro)/Cys-tRNA(Cys) deacylase
MIVPDTKVIRLLDSEKAPYRLLPHDQPVYTVDAAAAQRGVVRQEKVKYILLRDKNRSYVLACVTGDARLDPKAVRRHLGGDWKRLSFATAEEIHQVTGFVQGAIAPLCLPEDMPVIFDKAIAHCSRVNISSGDPMAGLELDPQDLIRLARAQLASIAL